MERPIRSIHNSHYSTIEGLKTYRPLPSSSLDNLDPFLFLNHHGPQDYNAVNAGLPFGPHPHRGFETLTFIFNGDVVHQDSNGFKSTIEAGGVQWMTAGSGLLHSEISSEKFKNEGGNLEIIQLWMNLPSQLKMVDPNYQGFQKNDLILHQREGATTHLIAGQIEGKVGPAKSLTDLTMMYIDFEKNAQTVFEVGQEEQILFYLVNGKLEVNRKEINTNQLVQFGMDGEEINVRALEKSRIIFGHGIPFNEPIVAQGPFVMNTREEIMQAMQDYQSGKMGVWN